MAHQNNSGTQWRKTSQPLLHDKNITPAQGYTIYPTHALQSGTIQAGFAALAQQIKGYQTILIDGYIGVFWEDFQRQLAADVQAAWINTADYMLPEATIDKLAAPSLGGDDPIFGKRATLSLSDLFDHEKLAQLKPGAGVTIVYGCGASLLQWEDAFLVYVDLPKNEIQYRSRAQTAWNLGQHQPDDPKRTYKRYYFFDWVLLNKHKAALLPQLDLIVDGQKPDVPTFMRGDDFRTALTHLAHTVFRVRPWFEPGAWGGHWIKEHLNGVFLDVPNYAWSFEMIAPEQGLIFRSDSTVLEVSFDFLMYHNVEAVLGRYANNFGYEFPIRFDFLDTIRGGNLSIQCHPRPEYIREQFGEHFTQDETYYILDCEPDAVVYLGFQENIDPAAFRATLEHSQQNAVPVEITDFVQQFKASKHDLFLIPNGTIHASGTGNMVLEISATPYIFTFKMYDWLRLDLDGRPRPINIERGFENLRFERRGEVVTQELLSKPQLVEETSDYRILQLPTHPTHFYDIQRLEITGSVTIPTEDSAQVLMVVEGDSIIVEVGDFQQMYFYAETFIIPAAAGTFRLTNTGSAEVKVVRAYMKAEWFEDEANQWLSLP